MNEKMEKKAEIPAKKKINKYDILAILLGIGLFVAGVLGIVTSLTTADDYNNSDDIRTVDAVIEKIERGKEKYEDKEDWSNKYKNYVETIHKMKLSFVVDGKTHQVKYYYRTFSYDRERDQFYNQLKRGDTIPVDVYKSRDGTYKVSPDNNPVDFLLYCAAIPVGLIIAAVIIYGILKPEAEQQNGGKGKKSKKRGQAQPGQKR